METETYKKESSAMSNPTPKRFKWTVEFEVDASWVADGFDLTDDRALDMLAKTLPFSNIGTELGATVVRKPTQVRILRAQGYSEAEIAKKCGALVALITK